MARKQGNVVKLNCHEQTSTVFIPEEQDKRKRMWNVGMKEERGICMVEAAEDICSKVGRYTTNFFFLLVLMHCLFLYSVRATPRCVYSVHCWGVVPLHPTSMLSSDTLLLEWCYSPWLVEMQHPVSTLSSEVALLWVWPLLYPRSCWWWGIQRDRMILVH